MNYLCKSSKHFLFFDFLFLWVSTWHWQQCSFDTHIFAFSRLLFFSLLFTSSLCVSLSLIWCIERRTKSEERRGVGLPWSAGKYETDLFIHNPNTSVIKIIFPIDYQNIKLLKRKSIKINKPNHKSRLSLHNHVACKFLFPSNCSKMYISKW